MEFIDFGGDYSNNLTIGKSKQYVEEKYTQTISTALNIFWIGFILYTTSYTLMISGVVSGKISYLQLLGIVMFLLPAIKLIEFKIENIYLRYIFIFYMSWLIFTAARGFSFNKEYIFETVIDANNGIFLYLMPLILLFPKDITFLKKLIRVIFVLSIFYIIFSFVFINVLLNPFSENGQTLIEYFTKLLAFPMGFIALTINYHKDDGTLRAISGKLWVLFVLFITFVFAAIRARRGLMFVSVNIIFFSYLLYIYVHKQNFVLKLIPFILILFISYNALELYQEKRLGVFSLIQKRIDEDTRSGVENYFYMDMGIKDWAIGRGIDGRYFCPSGATESGYREHIETDYLQIILKGGVISLALLLLIAIPALFKGLFYSKNILSKAAAIWILIWLIGLYPQTMTTFSMHYILVWISIGICYSSSIRNTPESIIRKQFEYRII